MRGDDGLPLANQPKTPETSDNQRAAARVLYQTLSNVAHAIKNGARNYDKLTNTARLALRNADLEIRKFSILDEDTLHGCDVSVE